MTEYTDERFCAHCNAETEHVCTDDTHERDSSGDHQRCTVCGWWKVGASSETYPPIDCEDE